MCIIALLAMWLSTRSYQGIIHDAKLYAVQALQQLGSSGLESDIFFKYGSQDSYSAFSLIYAPMVGLLGLGPTHLAFWTVGQIFWLWALFVIVRALFVSKQIAVISMIAVCLLMPNYGSGALKYGEDFVTPRLFSEILSMLAIAQVLKGRTVFACSFAVAAAVVHPLIALPILLIIILITTRLTPIVIILGVITVFGFFALAISGADPFVRVLQRIDAEWLDIVRRRSPHAFVADWAIQGSVLAALPVASLLFISFFGKGNHSRLARVTLITGSSLVMISGVAGDMLANLLVLNLQLWRSMWFVTLLGNIFVVSAVVALPSESRSKYYVIGGLIANVIEARLGTLPITTPLFLAAAGISYLAEWRLQANTLRFVQVAISAMVAVFSLVLVGEIAASLVFKDEIYFAKLAVQTLTILLASYFLITQWDNTRMMPWCSFVVAAALLVMGLWLADRETERMKYTTSNEPPNAEILAQIDGLNTYWEDGIEILWFKMRQPSYYSCLQGAGMMFFREIAIEYEKRSRVLSKLNTADFQINENGHCFPKANPVADGPVSSNQLRDACEMLPELDIMVLRANFADLPHDSWKPPYNTAPSNPLIDGFDIPNPRHVVATSDDLFHIYHCSTLRSGVEQPHMSGPI